MAVLTLATLHAQPERLRFDHLSVDDGLSNFTPLTLAQDRFGYLWIGTEDGLNRYDGHTFRVYRRNAVDSSSLDGVAVSSIVCDRTGGVWVTALGEALLLYNRTTDAFERFAIPNPEGESPIAAYRAVEGDEGLLWVGTNKGLFLFNTSTRKFRRVLHTSSHPALHHDAVSLICVESDNSIWIGGSETGVVRYNPRSNTLTAYRFSSVRVENPATLVPTSLAIDHQGNLWITSIGGVLRFDRARADFVQLDCPLSNGRTIGETPALVAYVDPRGTVWFGMFGDGLVRYDPRTGAYRQYRSDRTDPHALLTDRVMSMFEDASGVFWVGNYRTGLNRHVLRTSRFTPAYPGHAVYALAGDTDGGTWVGTLEGLFRTDAAGRILRRYGGDVPSPFRLEDAEVFSIARDSLGDVWAGTGSGLYRILQGSSGARHYVLPSPPRSPPQTVKALCTAPDGVLWAGIDQGPLHFFNRARDRFEPLVVDTSAVPGGKIMSVWSIQPDSGGVLWLATFGAGLFRFDARTGAVRHFRHHPDDPLSLPSDGLYFVRKDGKGNLWVGSFGFGLQQITPQGRHLQLFTVRDGLPNNFVKGMLEDSRGELWFSTDYGIARLDPATGNFRTYTRKDGLHGNVFLSGAYRKDARGFFTFGGEDGATMFHPDSLTDNLFEPSVMITGVRTFNRPISPLGGVTDSAFVLRLWHTDNFLSFEFTTSDFAAPEKCLFLYRLEDLDPDWIPAGTRRYASYTDLSPGTYRFAVRGTNSDGRWSPAVARLTVVIAPPFWQTWWFRGLVVLTIAGILVTLYNLRVNRLLEIERLRVRIASDLHDDIGSSLTRISLQTELLRAGIEPDERENYLDTIARLSRELITAMSDIVWSIDARNDTIGHTVDKMRSFATTLLASRDMTFTLAHSGLEVKKKLPVDIRENLYLLFKEAVTNAAKHSGGSAVSAVLRNDADKFTMVVADDGRGWKGEERPSGHGMRNMHMRSQRLGGSLAIVRDGGTRVILSRKRL